MSSPIKALIVDNEQSSRNVLRALLSRSLHSIEILGECEDVLQAIRKAKCAVRKTDLQFKQ
jgi:DNA-binding NtrC family response regulator